MFNLLAGYMNKGQEDVNCFDQRECMEDIWKTLMHKAGDNQAGTINTTIKGNLAW